MKKMVVLAVSLALLTCAQISPATIVVSDDFNRPDGPVGNGWSTWAGGGDIVDGELRTFFRTDAGGISRHAPIAVGQRITFSFDIHSDVGGWAMQINTTNAEHWQNDTKDRLAFLGQHSGEGGVYCRIGANLSHTWVYSNDARPFTQTAHISGIIEPDLSATISIDYNDGGPVANFNFVSPGIDPSTIPQGNLLSIGNSNDGTGNSFFDNFVVIAVPEPASLSILILGSVALLRRRKR